MKLGEEIAKLRVANNMTQEELGEKIGVSRQAVTKWESSLSTPELSKVIAIADLFDVSVDKVLGREETTPDLVKACIEELSSIRDSDGGSDISDFALRCVLFMKSLELPSETIVNGMLYICGEDPAKNIGL